MAPAARPRTALLERHTQIGDTALLFSLPITLLALVVWWRGREADRAAAGAAEVPDRRVYLAPASAALTVVIAVLSVVAAGSAAYDIYRIGDSGAQASWTNRVSAVSNGPEH